MPRLVCRINSRLLAIALLPILATSTLAQNSRQLFIPVEGDELDQVLIDNEYFVLKQAFVTKRHRIVRVNEQVLREQETLEINLFPDTNYLVRRESPRDQWGEVIHWQGWVINPTRAHPNGGADEGAADSHWADTHAVRFTGVAFDVDKLTGRSFAARSPVNVQGCKRPSDPSQLRHAAFYGFVGEISAPLQLDNFRLISLSASPQYHLIGEFDTMKMLRLHPENREQTELRQQYNEYLKSIGPDPRSEWTKRHQERSGC